MKKKVHFTTASQVKEALRDGVDVFVEAQGATIQLYFPEEADNLDALGGVSKVYAIV